MTDFFFDTIEPGQAQTILATDRILVRTGTAAQSSIVYEANDEISITIAGRTVVFGGQVGALARAGSVVFADGSTLYIGSAAVDVKDYGILWVTRGAFYAGDGNDSVQTGSGDFLIQGNQGDDRIRTGDGSVTVYGGQGNDSIVLATSKPSFIQGNKGDDTLSGGGNRDTILGGQGNDVITGSGDDFINGNLGDDILTGVARGFGEDGADTLTSSADFSSTLSGGAGDDRIVGSTASFPFSHVLSGDDGNDFIFSNSPRTDYMFGGEGADTIQARGLNDAGDRISGDAGNDSLVGGSGADLLDGGIGFDTLTARNGADTLTGGDGNDSLTIADAGLDSRLLGGAGDDYISVTGNGSTGANLFDGGAGNDLILDGYGDDIMLGGEGNDTIGQFGGASNVIDGGGGNDKIAVAGGSGLAMGGAGNDTIDAVVADVQRMLGGDGDDNLRGSTKNDTLSGGAGNDTIDAGGGADMLTGDAGADRFMVFRTYDTVAATPRILDWSAQDILDFGVSPPPIHPYFETTAADFAGAVAAVAKLAAPKDSIIAVDVGDDVIIFSVYGARAAAILVGRSLADISGENVI